MQRAKDQLERRLANSAANLKTVNSLLKKETADRKRAEEALRKANERLERQAEQSTEAMSKAQAGPKKKGTDRTAAETAQEKQDEQRPLQTVPRAVKDFKNFLQVVRNVAHAAKGDLQREDLTRVTEHMGKIAETLFHCREKNRASLVPKRRCHGHLFISPRTGTKTSIIDNISHFMVFIVL